MYIYDGKDKKTEGIHLIYIYMYILGLKNFTFSLSTPVYVRIRLHTKSFTSTEERYVVVLLSGSDGNIEK